jgi:hypothetical protein
MNKIALEVLCLLLFIYAAVALSYPLGSFVIHASVPEKLFFLSGLVATWFIAQISEW